MEVEVEFNVKCWQRGGQPGNSHNSSPAGPEECWHPEEPGELELDGTYVWTSLAT